MRAGAAHESHERLVEKIVGQLTRRHSTATVLFHRAIAERLGLGPTDHKCLDFLRERQAMTGSELAAVMGVTTGAITGSVARLEQGGYLRREADPHDRRKQILRPVAERAGDIRHLFGPIHEDVAEVLKDFDTHQLTAVAEFLSRTTDLAYRHVALLRARPLLAAKTAAARLHSRPQTHTRKKRGARIRR